jgi:hypothetical protein
VIRLGFLALLAALAVGGFLLMVRVGEIYDCRLCDFRSYVAAADRLFAGEPLYAEWQSRPYELFDAAHGEGFVYPPTSAVLLAWTTWIPGIFWRLLNLGAMAAASLLMTRRRGATTSLFVLAVLMLFSPMWNAWANGQVTPLLAAGFGLAWVYPRSAWVIAAVGGAIKLFPLILFAWVLRERGWREVGYGIALLIAIVGVTLPITGQHAWPDFAEASRNGQPICAYPPINSLRCVLGPAIGSEAAQGVALFTAAATTVVSLFMPSRVLAFALLCAGVIVAAPDLNRPYWLLALVALLAVVGTYDIRSVLRGSQEASRSASRVRQKPDSNA